MFKSIFLVLFLILTNSAVIAEGGVVAIINNEVVTQKDLDDFINFMRIQMSAQYSKQEVEQRINSMLPDLIDRLIEDRLILQAAYKENIIINQNRIKARVQQMRKGYLGKAEFQEALLSQGLSLADVELKIKEQLLMTKIIDMKIKSKIELKPQEVTNYYYAHSKDFNRPEQRQVRFLTIEDSELSEQIQKRIAEYKDLDAVASAYSLEITDLDWVTSKQLKEEITDVIFNLEVGRLSPVLNSDPSFYIFEVMAIKPLGTVPLSEIQEEISRFLFDKKMQESLVAWLEELKSEAYIEIKDNYGGN